MAQNDIYQLRLNYHDVNNEDMTNVFYYQQTAAGAATAAGVSASWIGIVFAEIQDMWPAATIVDSIKVINGMDNTDFDSDFTNRVGTNGSTAYMPSCIAVGMRNPSPGPGQQYAYKRFGGITNQLDAADGDFNSVFLTLANDLADVLDNVLSDGGIALTPCIIKGSFVLGVNPTFGRLVNTNWQVNEVPTTQNTRKDYKWN